MSGIWPTLKVSVQAIGMSVSGISDARIQAIQQALSARTNLTGSAPVEHGTLIALFNLGLAVIGGTVFVSVMYVTTLNNVVLDAFVGPQPSSGVRYLSPSDVVSTLNEMDKAVRQALATAR